MLWTAIRKKYLEGDYESAASLADEYRQNCIIDPVFVALDATLDVLTHKSDLAFDKFSALVREVTTHPRKRNNEYIEQYCYYYLALIRGEDASDYFERAQRAPATKHVRRSLPLVRPEQR